MKGLISILLLLGALTSCSYSDLNPSKFTGTASATKDGKFWRADVRVTKNVPHDIGVNITLGVKNNQGFWREDIYVFRVQTNLVNQIIYETSSQAKTDSTGISYATLIDDGDVLGDLYSLDTSQPNNYIRLTSIDLNKQRIAGVFSFTLKLTRDDGDGPVPPSTLKFTNGQFESRIEKEWVK